jgi:hypothetical protein
MTRKTQAAIFLGRVWFEDGQFRARISYSSDLLSETPAETELTTADAAELEDCFTTWLQTVLHSPAIGSAQPTPTGDPHHE